MYGLLYFKAESAKKSTFFHNNSECNVSQFCNPKIAKYNPQVTSVVCWFGVPILMFRIFISFATVILVLMKYFWIL